RSPLHVGKTGRVDAAKTAAAAPQFRQSTEPGWSARTALLLTFSTEIKARKAKREIKESRESLAQKDLKVTLGPKDLKVTLGPKDLKEIQDRRVPQGRTVWMVWTELPEL